MTKFKIFTDDELKEIVASSISWSEALRKCNRSPNGGSYQWFQTRVKKLQLNTDHFLGQAAHTGFRHTGKAKRKHWSEVLIKNSNLDREKGIKLRRVYKEYCEEHNIPVQCVDCGNKGEWRGKPLKLQINHKDEIRSNNVPENLEWVCPNCHDLKTYYNPVLV